MKEKYIEPEIEVIRFNCEDMILMSTLEGDGGEVDVGQDEDLG